MSDPNDFLGSTDIIDSDTPSVRAKALELTQGMQTDREKAVALYYFVRDEIKHNAYAPLYDHDRYKASSTLEVGNGFCQQKSVLLAALCRAAGIPARVGYVDVHDHQLSESFKKMIGGINVFPFHGYAEVYVDGKWVHASPAYDLAAVEKDSSRWTSMASTTPRTLHTLRMVNLISSTSMITARIPTSPGVRYRDTTKDGRSVWGYHGTS